MLLSKATYNKYICQKKNKQQYIAVRFTSSYSAKVYIKLFLARWRKYDNNKIQNDPDRLTVGVKQMHQNDLDVIITVLLCGGSWAGGWASTSRRPSAPPCWALTGTQTTSCWRPDPPTWTAGQRERDQCAGRVAAHQSATSRFILSDQYTYRKEL